jgi:hypothetical protein
LFCRVGSFCRRNIDDFYIIEADIEGYSLQVRNFFLQKIRTGVYRVTVYYYLNGSWAKNKKTVEIGLDMPDRLSDLLSKPRKGMNQDDVIISHMYKNGRVESQFFIPAALSKESGMKKILELN